MSDFCQKCGICCRLIPIDTERKTLLRDGVQYIDESFHKALEPISFDEAILIDNDYVENIMQVYPQAKFFSCKYLSDANLCGNFSKPRICSSFPEMPMAFVPENCGYSGVIFMKNEELKQKVRRLKEEIIHYESLVLSSKDRKEIDTYEKIIARNQVFIDKYKNFGSYDW